MTVRHLLLGLALGSLLTAASPARALDRGPKASGTTASGFTAALAADASTRATLRTRGLRARLRCSVACSAELVLRVDRTTAKRLGLRSTTLVRGHLSRSSAGRSTLRLRPSASVGTALAKVPAARLDVRAVVRAEDEDEDSLTLVRAVRVSP